MSDYLEQALEAWRTNNRINEILIDAISEEGMRSTLSTRGGRDVTGQFCHLHNVRYWQLEARAKELIQGLHKFPTKAAPDKDELKENLAQSADRVETFLREAAEGKPKRRGFKRGLMQHVSYFICHESHHRGNILLTIKQCGHNVDKDTRYAIWNWDKI